MFFKPLSKCSSCLSYVLLTAFQPITFVSRDYTNLFCYVVFVFWCTSSSFMVFMVKIVSTKIIIKNNSPHAPSKVDVMVSITFSHTPDGAMSVGLAKACVPWKKLFCYREIELPYWNVSRMRSLHSLQFLFLIIDALVEVNTQIKCISVNTHTLITYMIMILNLF